jgi:hypothetical protein
MGKKLQNKNLMSIVLIVAGVGLVFWGYKLSGGLGSQFSQALSGAPTDQVMTFYIVGAISLAVGAYFYVKK